MENIDFFFEGNRDLLENRSIKLAIVGSRSILPYTKSILEDLFFKLCNYDITIVSGGMYGVDLLSHNLALANKLKTIFVLPQSISSYKKSSLYSQIKFKNNPNYLFISKYNNLTPVKKYMFLERNRLIVELSNVVLVAQAALKSGSYSTGQYCLKNQKTLYSIPFSLENTQYQGTNLLISSGAKMYLTPDSIIKNLGFVEINIDKSIKDVLKSSPCSLEILNKKLGIEIGLLEKTTLELILRGEILFDGENYYL